MITEPVKISQSDIRRLLSAANPDAALLYLYINSGNRPEDAEADLHFSAPRYGCAAATLRQLGLWPEDRPSHIAPGERPSYCEKDVLDAMDSDNTFRSLYGEVQRLLGRSLNTEELKILLGFVRYLGLTADVISLLVCYCKERARQRGSLRNPSLRTIGSANFKTPYDNKVYELKELNGRLLSFGKSAGENSFYVPVTFEFDNKGDIIPGSFVEVYLLSSPMENVLSLPRTALTEEQGLFFAYLQLDEEGYKKQEVTLGADNGKSVQVLSGIKAGDRVVTQGAYQVKLASASNAIPAHSHEH